MSVVEHVTLDPIAGQHQTECARGGYTKVMHRLAAQKFADRGTQHCTAIRTTRIRRHAGALELQFQPFALYANRFAERNRPPIAELPSPHAKLMATVIGGPWLHAVQHAVAA